MKKIDRFVIRELVSDGSNGSVYQADEQLPGGLTRPVALKVLPAASASDPKAEQRFIEEIKLLIALSGLPNVVAVYSVGITDSMPWLAMEWIPTSLAQAMRETPIPPEHVMEMMRQVATALAALHALPQCVLHNDLTPGNIMVDKFGGYKITDFGLAGPAALERTRVLATVRYAAPELLSHDFGVLSPATDLYALGHIAYEMALGGKLYRSQFPAVYGPKSAARDGTPAKWMAWHCSLEARPLPINEIVPGFPPSLGMLIARLMLKQAVDRYSSAEALLADLKQIATANEAATGAASMSVSTAPPPAAAATAARSAPPARAAVTSPPPPLAQNIIPPEAPMELRYYVRLGDRTSGPYDVPALQRLLRRGEISRLHKVSIDRIKWMSLSSIEGLTQ